MAFSGFSNAGNSVGSPSAAGAAAVTQGPDLAVIQTEGLGFLSIAGDARLSLTSPWSPKPAPTASLLSIAPRKGLVAAAGPDAIAISTTDAVRKAFKADKVGDNTVRPFQPQLKLPLPLRVCQLAFTADENHLIISAEQGGGLAVYDVQALFQGATETSFQIPTNGEALRALVPNPSLELGDMSAVVTDTGTLLMANVKERGFVSGPSGQILKTQVSCAAWSNKGKQLVAGLGDGTIQQLTPQGEVKAQIPKPPGLNGNYFVSFLVWLENHVFLAVHCSTAEQPPQSVYHLITRQGQNFTFQKLVDPVDPFGGEKTPHLTATRLKDFPPNLQDLLIFSSTATPEIGLLTRSTAPLSSDNVTNVFATTELLDDSKRATLPMGEGMETPAPIGTALDLSSKENVYRPIPSDEMEESPGPLPGYWVLNDDGVLSAWWVVYAESIRSGTTYSGLASVNGNASQPATPSQPAQPARVNAFSAANASSFGAPTSASPAAFGGPSVLGAKVSPWGSQPASSPSTGGAVFGSSTFGSGPASTGSAFGAHTFGQASKPATFGQSSGLGPKSSPWASPAAGITPSFGQPSVASAGARSGNVFGSSIGTSSSLGFANFANEGGFTSVRSDNNNTSKSIFATSKPAVADESMDTDATTSFPPTGSKPSISTGNVFGSQPFKLTTTFQRDVNAKDDEKSVDGSSSGKSPFDSGFTAALGETSKTDNPSLLSSQPFGGRLSTTPTTTPAPSKFLSEASTTAQPFGTFGLGSKSSNSIFGAPPLQSSPFGTPKIKIEAEPPKPFNDIPDAPLPPESTSKASYLLGESSSSSAYSAADSPDTRKTISDAPLPDPSSKSKPNNDLPSAPESPPAAIDDAPLPPDPSRNKSVYAVKFPPLPGETSKPTPAEDAPLPPDPTTNKKAYDVKFAPVPGVKQPVQKVQSVFDTSAPKQSSLFVFPSHPPPVSDSGEEDDDEGEDEDSEHDDEDEDDGEDEENRTEVSEGSGVDVAKDLSPPNVYEAKDKTPGFTPGSSFDGGLGGSYSTISRPEPERKSLFGEIGRSVPAFPRPNPLSPRSPSPVRSAVPSRILGSEQSRSFSAPGMASQILGASKRPTSHGRVGLPITGKDIPLEDPRIEQQRKARAKKDAEEMQLLVDDEDDMKQKQLRAPIQPTLQLDEFIAHSGPIPIADDNVPAQVEAVYRDINAMIDTLGLNARSLTNFIHGHAGAFRRKSRDKDDLSNAEGWTIGELDDLRRIISEDLVTDLADSRVNDVEDKVAECHDLQRDVTRDRHKRNELQKTINSRLDPDQSVAHRSLPLTAEQAARQNDLRRDFARFSKLLAEAEEGLTVLRAKLVSANAANGKGGPAPTIDAIMRTIAKMTSMVEKRSGDIDVLENQMRKLRFSSPALNGSSREGTPTPKKLGSSVMFSPERSFRESTPQRSSMRHSMSASVSSIGGGMFAVRTPPRKKISGFGEAEKKAVKERRARRAIVLGKLKESVERRGATVWAVDDVE